MKVVINNCRYGGFHLSGDAARYLGVPVQIFRFLNDAEYSTAFEDDRANPKLVECVEKLGDKASGPCAELRIVEIPDGVDWYIHEYDGLESVHEKHRSWDFNDHTQQTEEYK